MTEKSIDRENLYTYLCTKYKWLISGMLLGLFYDEKERREKERVTDDDLL